MKLIEFFKNGERSVAFKKIVFGLGCEVSLYTYTCDDLSRPIMCFAYMHVYRYDRESNLKFTDDKNEFIQTVHRHHINPAKTEVSTVNRMIESVFTFVREYDYGVITKRGEVFKELSDCILSGELDKSILTENWGRIRIPAKTPDPLEDCLLVTQGDNNKKIINNRIKRYPLR